MKPITLNVQFKCGNLTEELQEIQDALEKLDCEVSDSLVLELVKDSLKFDAEPNFTIDMESEVLEQLVTGYVATVSLDREKLVNLLVMNKLDPFKLLKGNKYDL